MNVMRKEESNKPEKTLRIFAGEIRMEQREGGTYLVGLPVVYGEQTTIHGYLGDWDEVIARGALDGCDMSDVFLCVNHNHEEIPLARTRNGRGTMTLVPTDEGLRMEALLDVEGNSAAKSLYSAVQRGDVSGMSFAFRIGKESWTPYDDGEIEQKSTQRSESAEGLRTIEKIAMIHEVSAVTHPAYPGTYVATRSEQESFEHLKEVKEKRDALDLAKAKMRLLAL